MEIQNSKLNLPYLLYIQQTSYCGLKSLSGDNQQIFVIQRKYEAAIDGPELFMNSSAL